jgi:hypothetical protein
MNTDSNRKPTGDDSAPESAPTAFARSIEERYNEWENEFGDDVDARRTTSFDPKKK